MSSGSERSAIDVHGEPIAAGLPGTEAAGEEVSAPEPSQTESWDMGPRVTDMEPRATDLIPDQQRHSEASQRPPAASSCSADAEGAGTDAAPELQPAELDNQPALPEAEPSEVVAVSTTRTGSADGSGPPSAEGQAPSQSGTGSDAGQQVQVPVSGLLTAPPVAPPLQGGKVQTRHVGHSLSRMMDHMHFGVADEQAPASAQHALPPPKAPAAAGAAPAAPALDGPTRGAAQSADGAPGAPPQGGKTLWRNTLVKVLGSKCALLWCNVLSNPAGLNSIARRRAAACWLLVTCCAWAHPQGTCGREGAHRFALSRQLQIVIRIVASMSDTMYRKPRQFGCRAGTGRVAPTDGNEVEVEPAGKKGAGGGLLQSSASAGLSSRCAALA